MVRKDNGMNTTILPLDEYTLVLWTTYNEPEIIGHGEIGERVPTGPEVRFEIEEYDFDTLVERLIGLERELGRSSVEMFSEYLYGKMSLDRDMEEWLDLFILYLGTYEVRQFSCP